MAFLPEQSADTATHRHIPTPMGPGNKSRDDSDMHLDNTAQNWRMLKRITGKVHGIEKRREPKRVS